MAVIHGLYKCNTITFAAIILAFLFCIPLLGLNTSKPVNIKKVSNVQSATAQGDATDQKLAASGLTNLKTLGADFVYEQRYGTTNNFTGQKIYNSERVYLRPETAQKLAEADKEFNALGYRIKIWDAYRPYSVQVLLYQKVPSGKKLFIANPYNKNSCVHNRGAAVDITLVHMDGSPVEMPTDFDTFSNKASIYDETCSKQAIENRKLLAAVMKHHGFDGIECEWWHFNDTEAFKYSILDVTF